MKRFMMTAAVSAVFLWQCAPAVEPLSHTAPEVVFDRDGGTVSAEVGQPVTFRAEVREGDRLTSGWYVDGVLEASSDEFTYTFDAPGEYEVLYRASNGAGAVEKKYSVTVSDVLEIHLSVGDSLEVTRTEQSTMKFYAIVDKGSDVEHSWSVDGVKMSGNAFFGTYFLEGTADRTVSYVGRNSAGSWNRTFTVKVDECPLTVSFSETAASISAKKGETLELSATIVYGGSGAVQKWYVGSNLVSETSTLSYVLTEAGQFTVRYECVNGKGEKAERSWTLNVAARDEVIFEDFESGSYTCFKQGTLAVVDNPHKSGLNTSSKVLKASAPGSGGTSGFFTMLNDAVAAKGIKLSEYKGIKVLVWQDKGRYYPVMDFNGVKHLPDFGPEFTGEWEVLEYSLDFSTMRSDKPLQPRPFQILDANGKPQNITGAATETNPRVLYFDEFTFFK